jgi:hypothetical protein
MAAKSKRAMTLRHTRLRVAISGTLERPRLAVAARSTFTCR